MSAITGIFYRDGRSVDPESIKKMNNRLSHRGPDGSSTWCEGPVALGHQMLFTTPESLHEKLPFEDEESGLVITADARIDNRKELSELLELEDIEKVSDSMFILKAYEKWGEECPEKLLGDFAFAVWDKNNEKLFCARDHMGIKPFYYYSSDDAFFFATEIKAILCNPEVPHKLNCLMAAFYFIPITQEKVLTFYEKISRLPAAYSVTIDPSNVVIKKYWILNPNLKVKMDSDEDYINKFRDIFEEAVRCRLRSAFPIGAELSGGLDSSSVIGVAKKNLKNKKSIDTFSLITNFPEGDERFYIQKMINLGGIKPHFLFVDDISPLNDIEKILWHLDKPFGSANVTLFWSLYGKMQNEDIRVLLNGIDGDSTLSHGQNYLKELAMDFKIKKLINEIQGTSKIRNVNPITIFVQNVIFPMLPMCIKKLWKQNKREGDFILNNKELNKKLNITEKYKEFDMSFKSPKTAKELHYFLIFQSTHQSTFELIDSISSPFSIENRYPFFDKRLLEFCYGIPTEQKFKFGWDRLILRRAMTNILPEEIQWRPQKKHLTSVWEENLLKFEKKYLDELIYEKNEILWMFVDPSDIQDIYGRYKTKCNNYQRSDAWDIWNIVTFSLFIKLNHIS